MPTVFILTVFFIGIVAFANATGNKKNLKQNAFYTICKTLYLLKKI